MTFTIHTEVLMVRTSGLELRGWRFDSLLFLFHITFCFTLGKFTHDSVKLSIVWYWPKGQSLYDALWLGRYPQVWQKVMTAYVGFIWVTEARFPLAELTGRVDGSSTRIVETRAHQHGPCWLLTGNGNRSPVNSETGLESAVGWLHGDHNQR